eukprot:RCo047632
MKGRTAQESRGWKSLKETPLDSPVDVCIRTGSSTGGNMVGLLKLKLDTSLFDVRRQLVSLAGGTFESFSDKRRSTRSTPASQPLRGIFSRASGLQAEIISDGGADLE